MQADSDGFLISTPVDAQRQAQEIYGIARDVAAIRAGLALRVNQGRRATVSASPVVRSSSATDRIRGAGSVNEPTGRALLRLVQNGDATQRRAEITGEQRERRAKLAEARARHQERDGRGRFGPGQGDDDRGDGGGKLRNLIKDAVRDSMPGGGLDELDPTIAAANEVKRATMPVIAPLGRGMGMLFRSRKDEAAEGKRSTKWLSRIHEALVKPLRYKKPSAFKRAEQQVIGAGADDGGGGGLLGGLLRLLPMGGGLLKLLAGGVGGIGKAAMGGAGLLGRGLLKGGGALLGGLGKAGKFMGRLPVIGPLLGLLGAGASFLGDGDKAKGVGSGLGAVGGGLAGGALGATIGTMLLPGLGTVIGGIVGSWLGTEGGERLGSIFGEWVGKLADADIPGKIAGAWNGFVDMVKTADIPKMISAAWGGFVDWAKGAFDTLLSTGPGKIAKQAAEKVVEVGTAAVDKAKEVVNQVRESAPVKAATGAFSSAINWALSDGGGRRRQTFEGINGGSDLTRYGSYTDAEAARVRDLKASGANTSANTGGMSPEIRDKITAAATAAGLDPKMMLSMAAMESGGNANAISKTGALGLFQFTGRTATSVGVKDRFDVDQNIQGAMRLTQQNIAALQKAGLPATAENVYMAHQLGIGGAKDVARAAQAGGSVSPETAKAMGLNYGAGSASAADYVKKNTAALTARYNSVVASPSSSVPSVSRAAASVSVPNVGPAPQVAAGSGRGDVNVRVAPPPEDVGQNVSDRALAHLITGGLGGS